MAKITDKKRGKPSLGAQTGEQRGRKAIINSCRNITFTKNQKLKGEQKGEQNRKK